MLEALLVAGAISSPTSPTKELLETKPITETVQVVERPKLYTIQPGDNLTKIAKAHTTTVERLWSANPELTNPDRIEPSQSLKIPDNDEVLPEREMPNKIEPVVVGTMSSPQSYEGFSSRSGKSTPGWYYAGQCTAWVANKRFVPDGWGNASDWKWHAQAEGWTVSSVPVAGAIGWTYGHVVYIESVNGDTVTISEQNWDFNGSIRTVTKPVSTYTYLY